MNKLVTFKISGRYALFTDPITKIGGEKYSYPIPTYEALKGIVSSVYWKPTIVWIIERLRVMRPIRTEAKSVRPLIYSGVYPGMRQPGKQHESFNTLAIYTYLSDVEYQVQARFIWNKHREDLRQDRNPKKHLEMARRMIECGGRRDVFLGTRECQGYVEPCDFGEGAGFYDHFGDYPLDLMFHGFDYPDETGQSQLTARFWRPEMVDGIVNFIPPEKCVDRKFVRIMKANPPKSIGLNEAGLFDHAQAWMD